MKEEQNLIVYNIAKYFFSGTRSSNDLHIWNFRKDWFHKYIPTYAYTTFRFRFSSINLFMLLVVQQLNACFSPLSFFHHIKQLLYTGENVVSRRFRYLIHSNFVLVKNFFSSEWMHLSCFCPLLYKKLIQACRFIFLRIKTLKLDSTIDKNQSSKYVVNKVCHHF